MSIIKATGHFVANKSGWSETWYKDVTATTNDAAFAAVWFAGSMWQKRVKMLGVEARLNVLEVSFVDILNDSYPAELNWFGTLGFHSAYPGLALLMKFFGTTPGTSKSVYLRGIDDNVSMNAGIQQLANPTVAAFAGALADWQNAVVTENWGYYSLKKSTVLTFEGLGYGVSLVNDKYIEVTCAPNTFPVAQFGTHQVVNFSKVNDPFKSPLNGRHVVKVLDDHTCIVVRPMALFPWNGFNFTINRYTPVFNQVRASIPRLITTRDTGRPAFERRGRRQVIPRG